MKSYSVQFGTSGDPRISGLAPTFLAFFNIATGASVAPPTCSELGGASFGFYTFNYGTTQPIVFLLDAATTSPGASGRYVFGQLDPNDRADEIGTSMIALGTTGVAIGTTHFGQGVSLLALGNTNVALGTSNIALGTSNIALGFSNIAIGTSNIALGTTAVAGINALGSTLGGIGVTLIALGTTNVALGTSAVALGNFIGSTASSYGTTAIDPTTVFGFLIRAQEITEGNQTYTKSTGVLDLFTRGASLLREKTIADTSTTTTKS